jgi:AraC-like DNA-binding protein
VDAHGNAWDLSPGWCFQRLPGIPQSTYLDPASGWLEVFIDLGGRLHDPLAAMRVLPPEPAAFALRPGGETTSRMLDLVAALEVANERDLPRLVARAIDIAAQAIATASALPAKPAGDAIDEACRLLAEESSRRIDLASWCASRGLDYERFRKDFRQRTGLPPHRYRIRRRIDRACALLRQGLSVQQTAAELGYPSPFEFSAQFRAHLGVPPSRWR